MSSFHFRMDLHGSGRVGLTGMVLTALPEVGTGQPLWKHTVPAVVVSHFHEARDLRPLPHVLTIEHLEFEGQVPSGGTVAAVLANPLVIKAGATGVCWVGAQAAIVRADPARPEWRLIVHTYDTQGRVLQSNAPLVLKA